MAFAEKRGDWYRIVFRFGGKRYRQTLDTGDEAVADSVVGGVKRTLMLLEQRVLTCVFASFSNIGLHDYSVRQFQEPSEQSASHTPPRP
jgi:hypothetical protein